MNKEQEEMIKEQERNKEEMEEIMREIEITCLGELIKWETTSKRIAYHLEWLFEPVLDRENIRSVKKLSREKSYLS